MASQHADRIGVRIGFDEALVHLIEAGADIFLMPSRFEPCGLNQMFSLRYGAVPVVRSVGGLVDIVDESVGFRFSEYTPQALVETLNLAITTFREDKAKWSAMIRRGMLRDCSWEHSASEYSELYRRLVHGRMPGRQTDEPSSEGNDLLTSDEREAGRVARRILESLRMSLRGLSATEKGYLIAFLTDIGVSGGGRLSAREAAELIGVSSPSVVGVLKYKARREAPCGGTQTCGNDVPNCAHERGRSLYARIVAEAKSKVPGNDWATRHTR